MQKIAIIQTNYDKRFKLKQVIDKEYLHWFVCVRVWSKNVIFQGNISVILFSVTDIYTFQMPQKGIEN